MNRTEIEYWDHKARENYLYEADPIGNDNWRSHADDVISGIKWRGDCDDLGSTVLDLLGREGEHLDKRYRLLVSTAGTKRVDHFVGLAISDEGDFLIVGDTMGQCYSVSHMRWKVLYYNRLDEAGDNPIWREGEPWQAYIRRLYT